MIKLSVLLVVVYICLVNIYNEDLIIPAYYENDKTTKNELDSVLKYISSKYNINNKEKIK